MSSPNEYQGQAELSNRLLISDAVAQLIRDGLRGQIATTSQWVTHAESLSGGREHPERFQAPLADQDALRALMEKLGWKKASDRGREYIEIDLRAHLWALLEALQDQITSHIDQLRDCGDDTKREAKLKAALTELTALSLTVLLKTTSQPPTADQA
jgi:hypothetical protein